MRLMDRVKEVQENNLMKRLEFEKKQKADFLTLIEADILKAADLGKTKVTVAYPVDLPIDLISSALQEQGFYNYQITDRKVEISLKSGPTRKDMYETERLIKAIFTF